MRLTSKPALVERGYVEGLFLASPSRLWRIGTVRIVHRVTNNSDQAPFEFRRINAESFHLCGKGSWRNVKDRTPRRTAPVDSAFASPSSARSISIRS